MKNVDNCPQCGSIFVKTLRPICHQCYEKQEKEYEKVSRFMRQRKNRQATIKEVHEETGVDLQQIQQFIREGRLLVSQFPNLAYPCESCGKDIQEGRICEKCKNHITSGLNQLEEEKAFDELKRNAEGEERKKAVTYHLLNDRLK